MKDFLERCWLRLQLAKLRVHIRCDKLRLRYRKWRIERLERQQLLLESRQTYTEDADERNQ